MSVDFTIQEKIELIVGFYDSYGYIAENIDDFPIVKRFIEAGYAELNENNVYVKNKQGSELLHDTIEAISMDLINNMKKSGWTIPLNKMLTWFIEYYCLSDKDIGELLMNYIHKNLQTYGYNIYPSQNRGKFILEKV